jgi:hypothetical protein
MKSQKNHKKITSTYVAMMDNYPKHDELYFKIGKSVSIDTRIRQIISCNPFVKTILVHNFDCERYLHNELSEYKIKNEWFCIPDAKTKKDIAIKIHPLIIEYIEHHSITKTGKDESK